MKVDDSKALGFFDENLDEYWYEMGREAYMGKKTSLEVPSDADKNKLLSFRKGVLAAARDMGDLEREDFYSETAYNAFNPEERVSKK